MALKIHQLKVLTTGNLKILKSIIIIGINIYWIFKRFGKGNFVKKKSFVRKLVEKRNVNNFKFDIKMIIEMKGFETHHSHGITNPNPAREINYFDFKTV